MGEFQPTKTWTDAALRNLTAPGYQALGGGLYVNVRQRSDGSLGKSFSVRYPAPNGRRRREKGLGVFPEVKLAAARKAALKVRDQARINGVDAVEVKRQARITPRADVQVTVRQAVASYIATQEAAWKNAKHGQQWKNTLEDYVLPRLGDMAVGDVGVEHVLAVLKPIWATKPETARRVRGRLEKVLAAEAMLGHRSRDNPAAWRGCLETLLPKRRRDSVKHHAALAYSDLPQFIAELRAREGAAARALEFAILCAARTGEVIGARWSELDLKKQVWLIPAARMKASKSHRVPLSAQAMQLLRDVRETQADDATFVFPSPARRDRALSNMAMLTVLRRMGRATVSVHGMRATFKTWATETTNVPREVVEQALAHSIGNAVEQAYSRGDMLEKRHALMAAWSNYCDGERASKSNVVTLKTRRRKTK